MPQAYLSAQETPPPATSRVPRPYGVCCRPPGHPTTSSKGPDPSQRLATPRARDRRLHLRADFDRVFQRGRHNSGRLIAVRSAPNDRAQSRYAYAISKRVGKAVVRNKARRRLREALRSLAVREGFDIVITVRPPAAQASFQELKAELARLLQRGRLLDEREW